MSCCHFAATKIFALILHPDSAMKSGGAALLLFLLVLPVYLGSALVAAVSEPSTQQHELLEPRRLFLSRRAALLPTKPTQHAGSGRELLRPGYPRRLGFVKKVFDAGNKAAADLAKAARDKAAAAAKAAADLAKAAKDAAAAAAKAAADAAARAAAGLAKAAKDAAWAAGKGARDKAAAEKAARDKAAADKAAAEKAARDQAARDKAAAEKDVRDKAAAEKAVRDKAAADKAAAEKAIRDKRIVKGTVVFPNLPTLNDLTDAMQAGFKATIAAKFGVSADKVTLVITAMNSTTGTRRRHLQQRRLSSRGVHIAYTVQADSPAAVEQGTLQLADQDGFMFSLRTNTPNGGFANVEYVVIATPVVTALPVRIVVIHLPCY